MRVLYTTLIFQQYLTINVWIWEIGRIGVEISTQIL